MDIDTILPGIPIKPLVCQPLHDPMYTAAGIEADLLRLDVLHPQVSGNKLFKLRYFLQEACEQKVSGIVSFGGVWSNHLHALAYACHQVNMPAMGIIRGELVSNAMLQDCRTWGMQLETMSREDYRSLRTHQDWNSLQAQFPGAMIIPEGADDERGRKGCEEILRSFPSEQYTHILCAVGTGTTLCGLIRTALPHQQVWGMVVLKGANYLDLEISKHVYNQNWQLWHEVHWGGFARMHPEVYATMQAFHAKHQIELDIVYTSKLIGGFHLRLKQGHIARGARVLLIHTGGLQGNRSLISSLKNP